MPKSTTSAGKTANDFPNGTVMTKGSEVDTSGLSQTLQRHVDDIRSLIQCGICIRPLYEPFTIACGHTFCYDCLANWFSSTRHNKTCPDCRTPVETQPSPAYLVRAIVQLFTSRAELLDKGETTVEHTKNQREDAEKVEKDKKNDDHREGGLFRGAFKPRLPIVTPIVDLEDNVVRCPNCGWELEEDSCCAQCGYSQDFDSANWTDGSGQWSEGEENSEMTDYDDDDAIEDGFGEINGYNWPAGTYNLPPASGFARPETTGWRSNPHTHTIEDSEGEDDEEDDYSEDEDMDSFIDDDEYEDGGQREYESEPSTVVGGADYSTQDRISSDASRYSHFGVEEATEEDREEVEGEEGEGEETGASDDEVDGLDYEDDENDEDDDEDPIRPPVTGQRHHRMSRPTGTLTRHASATSWAFNRGQSRSPHFGANREIPRDQRSTGTGSSAYNTIDISEDSEDEGPVAPTRRRMPGTFI